MAFIFGRRERREAARRIREAEGRAKGEAEKAAKLAEKQERLRLEEEVSRFVLPMSVADYIKSGAKLLPYQYEYRSVESFSDEGRCCEDRAFKGKLELMNKAKELGAEAVVNVTTSHTDRQYSYITSYIGLAVIPKKAGKRNCNGAGK